MKYVIGLIALFVAVFALPPAFAQGTDRATVTSNAPIFVRADPPPSLVPLRVAAVGTELVAFEAEGDWLRVQFRDPQFGLRTGYVETRLVRIDRVALRPTDLSVPSVATARQQQPAAPGTPRPSVPPPTTNEPLVRIGEVASPPGRVFIDFSYMEFYPLQKTQTVTSLRAVSGGSAVRSVVYPELLAARGLDVGATFGSGPIGFGFRWMRPEFIGIGGLGVTAPHPTFANRSDSDVNFTGLLTRKEHVIDVALHYNHNRRAWRLSLFGGPTFFHLKQDMVSDIRYSQLATTTGINVVGISSYTENEVSGTTLGVNGGLDVAWFFSRFVGVGGGVRLNYGSMPMNDPLTGEEEKFRVGSSVLVVGPRFRF
jgi:hypothetical protein